MKTSNTRNAYKKIYQINTLYKAWLHVRGKAFSSSSAAIREEAEQFDRDIFKNIRRIQREFRENKYLFKPSTGVLKDKKKREKEGKSPRPIMISNVETRVVQRAILDILQMDTLEANSHDFLGKINKVNNSLYSVGGIKKSSVPIAIARVLDAIKNEEYYFFKSDIEAFFTKIPHEPVVEFIRAEVRDDNFTDIFKKALEVELENVSDLGIYADLFPGDDYGVPQGSSLSAFAGNVLLYEFDKTINSMEVKCYRYIDDLIIISSEQELVDKAVKEARRILKNDFGMDLYYPSKTKDKAQEGKVKNGFTFLGCDIEVNNIQPSKKSKNNILSAVDRLINNTISEMKQFSVDETKKRSTQSCYLQCLVQIDKKIHGWAKSFSFVNNRIIFRNIDIEIDNKIKYLRNSYQKLSASKSMRTRRRMQGVYVANDVEKKSIRLTN